VASPPDILASAVKLRDAMRDNELVAELAKDGGGTIGDALREVAHDDLVTVAILPDGAVNSEAVGRDGFIAIWRDWTSSFERFELEPIEEPVVRGEAMVNIVRQTGWIAGNPIPAEGTAAWFFRDGKLARIEFHLSRERALRAIGVEPG
jgi:hypothetical protein